jgi:hypothetical protein
VGFDYSLRGSKEISVWFTLLIILVCLVGIPIGIVILLTVLLILMPIHIGVSGYYHDETYAAEGWAKVFAGLVGVVFEYDEQGGQLQVVIGKRIIWQQKEDAKEEQDQKVSDSPSTARAGPIHKIQDDSETESPVSNVQREVPFEPVPSDAENVGVPPAPPIKQIETHDASSEHTSIRPTADPPASILPKPPAEDPKPSLWVRVRVLWVQFVRYLGYWQAARPILFHFFRRLMRILSFRYIDIQAVYGASDPAQTGRLFGYAEAIRPMLGKQCKLVLTPDFTQMRFAGAGAVEISLYLSRLFWAILALGMRGGLLGAKIWWRERQVKRSAVLNEA